MDATCWTSTRARSLQRPRIAFRNFSVCLIATHYLATQVKGCTERPRSQHPIVVPRRSAAPVSADHGARLTWCGRLLRPSLGPHFALVLYAGPVARWDLEVVQSHCSYGYCPESQAQHHKRMTIAKSHWSPSGWGTGGLLPLQLAHLPLSAAGSLESTRAAR